MCTWHRLAYSSTCIGEQYSRSGRLNESAWKSWFGLGVTGMSLGPPEYVGEASMPRR